MSYYGYEPAQFSTNYMAQGVVNAGQIISNAVAKMPELAKLHKNELSNQALVGSFKTNMDKINKSNPDAFKRSGFSYDFVSKFADGIDKQKTNTEVVTSLLPFMTTIGQQLNDAEKAKLFGEAYQQWLGTSGTQQPAAAPVTTIGKSTAAQPTASTTPTQPAEAAPTTGTAPAQPTALPKAPSTIAGSPQTATPAQSASFTSMTPRTDQLRAKMMSDPRTVNDSSVKGLIDDLEKKELEAAKETDKQQKEQKQQEALKTLSDYLAQHKNSPAANMAYELFSRGLDAPQGFATIAGSLGESIDKADKEQKEQQKADMDEMARVDKQVESIDGDIKAANQEYNSLLKEKPVSPQLPEYPDWQNKSNTIKTRVETLRQKQTALQNTRNGMRIEFDKKYKGVAPGTKYKFVPGGLGVLENAFTGAQTSTIGGGGIAGGEAAPNAALPDSSVTKQLESGTLTPDNMTDDQVVQLWSENGMGSIAGDTNAIAQARAFLKANLTKQ